MMSMNLRFRSALWLMAVMATCAMGGPVAAQGTEGMLPGPVSSHDLERYAERLALNDHQRAVVEKMHTEYRDAFRQLREDEIEDVLESMRAMAGVNLGMPQREAVEGMINDVDRAMTRIAQVDNRFFSRIDTALHDDQHAMLYRVRDQRARQRYGSGMMMQAISILDQSARVDLSTLYDDLELTELESEIAEPMLIQYERKLTDLQKKLSEASSRIILDLLDAIQELGLGDTDPTDLPAAMNAYRAAWSQVSEKVTSRADAITEHNERTVARVGAILAPPKARQLRLRYYRRAYPNVPADPNSLERKFEAAMRLQGVSAEQRDAVLAATLQYQTDHDRITNELIEIMKEMAGGRTAFDIDFGKMQEMQKRLAEHSKRWAALNDTAADTLDALLGAELAAQLGSGGDNSRSIEAAPTVAIAPAAAAQGDESDEDPQNQLARITQRELSGIIGPISAREAQLAADRLEIDESDREIFLQLHLDYLADFGTWRQSQDDPSLGVNRAIFTGMELSEAEINQSADDQKQSIRTLLELEQTFFDDILLLLAEDDPRRSEVERLHLMRQRTIFTTAAAPATRFVGSVSMFGGSEANVDLPKLVLELELTTIDNDTDALLMHYERDMTATRFRLFDESVEALRKTSLAMIDARREAEAANGDGDQAMLFGAIQMMSEATALTRGLSLEIRDANRQMLAALLQTLPSEDSRDLRRAYYRRSYPYVFASAPSAEDYVSRALELENLEPEQRAVIRAVELRFITDCDKLDEELVGTIQEYDFDAQGLVEMQQSGDVHRAYSRAEILKFDRVELNSKAIRRLRELLTATQRASVGLPDGEDSGN